jgi:hypothetical protein
MIGSLPKLLDKNFAIGFFVPALLAVIGVAWIFPSLTVLNPIRTLGASDKVLTDLTYVVLIVWVVAIILMTANHALYRILEGYLPPVSWMRPLVRWHRWRFNRLKTRYDALMIEWQTASGTNQEFPDEDRNRVSDLRRKLLSRYPSSEAELRPTRFGNIIRSFEVYPRELYGVDSVPVWLRLASVIPKDFTSLLDDARSEVNFFVNLMYLALLIAVASSANAVYATNWHHLPISDALRAAGLRHIVVPATAFVISVVAYYWATTCAMAWGDLVKSAFDCYLPALIKQLGFAVPPTEAERLEFWDEFSALITFQQPMTPDRWPIAGETGSGNKQSTTGKEASATEAAAGETRAADAVGESKSQHPYAPG